VYSVFIKFRKQRLKLLNFNYAYEHLIRFLYRAITVACVKVNGISRAAFIRISRSKEDFLKFGFYLCFEKLVLFFTPACAGILLLSFAKLLILNLQRC